jgi:hypothetical protein
MYENGPKVISSDTVAIGAGATGYSIAVKIYDLDTFALEYKASCTGTPNVKIELQQSTDGENWYIPDTLSEVVPAVTDKSYHGRQLAPITVGLMRFKITEMTEVVDDATVLLKVVAQKRYTA